MWWMAQGSVVAAISPTVYAPSSGTVTLMVNAGDKVTKDQVLAEVLSPELNNRLRQEQATRDSLDIEVQRLRLDHRKQQLAAKKVLDQAMIDRQTAKREVERTQRAFDAGAMSEMDLLRTKDALAKADISVANAEAEMNLDVESLAFELKSKQLAFDRQGLLAEDLQRQVDELKVRSPVDGQVGQLWGLGIFSYDDMVGWPCDEEKGPPQALLPPNDPGHPDYQYYFTPRNCLSYGNQVYNNTIHGFADGIRIYPLIAENTIIRNNALSGWTRPNGSICHYNASNGTCPTLSAELIADHNVSEGDFVLQICKISTFT